MRILVLGAIGLAAMLAGCESGSSAGEPAAGPDAAGGGSMADATLGTDAGAGVPANPADGAAPVGSDDVMAALDSRAPVAGMPDAAEGGGSPGDAANALPSDTGTTSPDASAVAGGACPPAGPFGKAVGDVVPDVTLSDCDGNPVHLHDLCASDAAFIFSYSGW